ncbi:MAG TPA: hypothetical protein HPP97_06995 [Desulfuromonadales bacterium]|nr:hypothetical protein [Desulfuromonadales bacterium]
MKNIFKMEDEVKSNPSTPTLYVGGAPSRVIHAINHFICIGDDIGIGGMIPDGENLIFLIPLNPKSRTEVHDLNTLHSRLKEIECPKFKFEDWGEIEKIRTFSITINFNDCDAFATVLSEKPGPLGWGSSKKTIDMCEKRKKSFVNY